MDSSLAVGCAVSLPVTNLNTIKNLWIDLKQQRKAKNLTDLEATCRSIVRNPPDENKRDS